LKRKLILRCGYAPGDIVMLTAAVRDLHHCYPRRFRTDVRTLHPALWEHNPHVSPIADEDPDAETIECSYPLINRSNRTPHHCLNGFVEFLNDRLKLAIKPTAFKGDIHLSAQERAWCSQVQEVTDDWVPFWIIAAGGKYDITIKWWESARFQQVVDHFHGRILFVQVGKEGNHHPRLDGVIDLRGATNLRELVRLMHHAQGVLCPVTSLMHLAAAVPGPHGSPATRPCVVVAGGREPAHWEAYPDHQFIHTNGALPCAVAGGCWKDRTIRLRDGGRGDRPENRCLNLAGNLPRCMDLITPEEVARRIELYFQGAHLQYLNRQQKIAAWKGIAATRRNSFDRQPLGLPSAGLACDQFVQTIPPYPGGFAGRGIVICGGGVKYFTTGWVCINMLRRLGCRLPIQFWHLGRREMDNHMVDLLTPLGVECIDAGQLRRKHPARRLGGWELKSYALLHSSFREMLLLDADNIAVVNPEFLFEIPEYRETGAIFWPDRGPTRSRATRKIWRSCGLSQPNEQEFESGQILVDKERCWRALVLSRWFNDQSDFYYRHIHGDKDTFHLAFRKVRQPYALVPHRVHEIPGVMCQHDFQGRRIFQHRNGDKYNLALRNKIVPDFQFESECRSFIRRLRSLWKNGLVNRQDS
jgi:ADP-heptose:LPS heptosyltransferase